MNTTVLPFPLFIDKLGVTGKIGDQVVVPVLDDNDMPQLEIAAVIDIVRRPPSPLASELSVRTRVGDDESGIYEPEEIIVLVRAAPAPAQSAAAPSTKSTRSLRPPTSLRAEQ
ncbi:hypothetical protein [Arthrobacter bambusae]|uniref:Uncharacterized protein n=1 Tax=Arthrobacter bambusae TaxID=1338426 RepID=A0AAW8DD87_9MICC|nr:hypothetical protein [Arthrobacter bambusae]MDP9904594.1 hypothetical protein [Arthrobacter bambusae]MDQ0129410.1 hypothetical protein [Arthrobacter bambusae]MDQ0180977.1 hypothetical protein [Arthrobacter bambusae]